MTGCRPDIRDTLFLLTTDAELAGVILTDLRQWHSGIAQRSELLREWLEEEYSECLRRGKRQLYDDALATVRQEKADKVRREKEENARLGKPS